MAAPRSVTLIVAALLAVGALSAGSQPDFSGTWILDKDHSFFAS